MWLGLNSACVLAVDSGCYVLISYITKLFSSMPQSIKQVWLLQESRRLFG